MWERSPYFLGFEEREKLMSSTKAGGAFMLPIFARVCSRPSKRIIEDILAWSEGFPEAR